MCSRGDLPQPDGPTTATNSPSSTRRSTPLSAGTSTLPTRYTFFRSLVEIMGSNQPPREGDAGVPRHVRLSRLTHQVTAIRTQVHPPGPVAPPAGQGKIPLAH